MRTLHITATKEPIQEGTPTPGTALVKVGGLFVGWSPLFHPRALLTRIHIGALSPFDIELLQAPEETQPHASDIEFGGATFLVTTGLFLAHAEQASGPTGDSTFNRARYLVSLAQDGTLETALITDDVGQAFKLLTQTAQGAQRDLASELTATRQALSVEADRLAELHGWSNYITRQSPVVLATAILARAYYHNKVAHPNPTTPSDWWYSFVRDEVESKPHRNPSIRLALPLMHL